MNKFHIDFPLVFQLFIVNQLRRRIFLLTEISVSRLEREYSALVFFFLEYLSKTESFYFHMFVLPMSTLYAMRASAWRQHLQKS